MTGLTITRPRTLMPGLTVLPTHRDIVVVNLHYTADPIAFTPEILVRERRRLGCVQNPDGTWKDSWRWRKEMELDWTAQKGQAVFEGSWLDHQRQFLRDPAYRMDWGLEPVGMTERQFCEELPEGFAYTGGERKIHRDTEDRVVLSRLFFQLGEDKRRKALERWLVRRAEGRLAVYAPPDAQPPDLPTHVEHVTRAVGLGMDVSEGVEASDSTIVGYFADRLEQCCELADNRIKPANLGRFAAAVARYYNDALICCVRKMHGITAIRSIWDDAGYGRMWHSIDTSKQYVVRRDQLGWAGGEATSPYLFGKWMDALQHHRPIIRSLTLLQQHQQYIYDEAGRITHQRLVSLPPAVRERHGDLVVGSALAFRACVDLPKFRKVVEVDPAPPGSLAWRDKQFKERDRAAERSGEVDW